MGGKFSFEHRREFVADELHESKLDRVFHVGVKRLFNAEESVVDLGCTYNLLSMSSMRGRNENGGHRSTWSSVSASHISWTALSPFAYNWRVLSLA